MNTNGKNEHILYIHFFCLSFWLYSFIRTFVHSWIVAVAISDELEGNTDQINFALNINSVISSKQKSWESGREENDFNAD